MDSTSIALGTGLSWFDWLQLIGSVISIASLLGFLVSLVLRVQHDSPRIAIHEFALLVRQPWHVVIALVTVFSTGYLVAVPPERFPFSLLTLIPVGAGFLLMMSFFLAQSRRLSGAVIINEMSRLARRADVQRGKLCSAIRFDIDRLKAISNYSKSVGEQIQEIVLETIVEEVQRARKRGLEMSVVEIPGEDETVVIAVGLAVEEAADIADEIRRRVRSQIQQIPYYDRAVDFVVERLTPPPSVAEERQGIGTVSAGVAAYRGSEETFLSDVSAAVKESKTRGRNKTVIYRPGRPSEIRSDYVPAAPKAHPDTDLPASGAPPG